MTPASWLKRFRTFFANKLGLCRRCLRLAAIGTVLSWLLYAIAALLLDRPALPTLLLIVALAFSILLLAHLVAHFFRVYLPLSRARRNLRVVPVDFSLSALRPNQVTGVFKQDDVGLSFDARIRDEKMSLTIRDLQGRDLLIATESNGRIEQSILDNRLTISAPKIAVSEPLPREQIERLAEKHLSEISVHGETECFQKLQSLPAFRLLPLLSKTLGVLGVDGARAPAVISLHLVALGTFTYQQRQQRPGPGEPSGGDGGPDVVYAIKRPFQDLLESGELADFLDGDIVPCGDYVLDEHLIHLYPPEYYNERWRAACEPCDCSDDKPNEDDGCYGMCGDGCDCWCFICGDCCYHLGCAIHDTWCRNCEPEEGQLPGCAGCYSPAALVGISCWLQI